MIINQLLISSLLFLSVQAIPRGLLDRRVPPDFKRDPGRQRGCGTLISPDRADDLENQFQGLKPPPSLFLAVNHSTPAVIPVYWHAIAENKTAEGGWIPKHQLKLQMDVMNADYNSTGIQFHHVSTTRVINKLWFRNVTLNDEDQLELPMKKRLRRGDAGTLNIYTVSFQNDGTLGFAAYPADYNQYSVYDGIVIRYTTLPGNPTPPYNLGRTLTHETGHWLGLYHTFQGESCDGPGDYVDDTPQHSVENFGCPSSVDTCVGGGDDPIHNFMDYTDDDCMNQFTLGQTDRLKDQIRTFRNITV
ncbi:metalloprotease [Pluteus cervinus]|uniref:Metalloprotease n=1 Tax=Pluteus cervinus TaxID=181527 RepID=A0ACD3B2V6_9AGAR|nr:metalloprotease [Pluteus cervinus]